MKKAAVIKKKATGAKAFLSDRKNWVLCGSVSVILALTTVSMPLSYMPGGGRMAASLSVSPDAMRGLTIADVAAYAAGIENNRVYQAQQASAYTYAGGGAYGGLSPFGGWGLSSGSRLINAREAYLKEYELTGKYPKGIAGPLSLGQYPGTENFYEGVPFASANGRSIGAAPVIDPGRITAEGNAEYGSGYGSPVGGAAGGIGARVPDAYKLPIKARTPLDIIGSAGGGGDYISRSLEGSAGKFKNGKLGAMGGFNAKVNRIGSKKNAYGGQMGVLSSMADVGKGYFYSYNAGITGYKTAAKHIADAAFDGAEVEPDTLIIPGEAEEIVVNDLASPNTVMDKVKGGLAACSKAKKTAQASLDAAIDGYKKSLEYLTTFSSHKVGAPGCCSWTYSTSVGAERKKWNGQVDALVAQCNAIEDMKKGYAGTCGMNYKSPTNISCDTLLGLKVKGGCDWNIISCRRKVKMHNSNLGRSCGEKGRAKECNNQVMDSIHKASDGEVTGLDKSKWF